MTPYDEYIGLDYEKLSEGEMLVVMFEIFDIDPTTKNGLFDQEKHYTIIESIMVASLKLRYEMVKTALRGIYPLSFPEIEGTFEFKPAPEYLTGDEFSIPEMDDNDTKEAKMFMGEIDELLKAHKK